MKNQNCRTFLRNAGIAASGALIVPTIIPVCARGKNGNVAPSDRINLAFIEAGNQAGNDVKQFLKDKRVQVTAICDVNKESSGYWNGKFIDCVISREQTAAPVEVGHRSIAVAHLGNIAIQLKQDLEWDPVKERFIGNEVANSMLSREMREPWGKLYRKYVV